ncbi:MAG: NAD-dependent DNA ligase LigA [Candidatus Paceibacteria bacterium]
MITPKNNKKRLLALRKLVTYHQQKYHTEDTPEISDEAYDALVAELRTLELSLEGKENVSSKVGGEVSSAFAKVRHQVRQWSFDNVFSLEELREWEARLLRNLAEADMDNQHPVYVVEHKIDGLKLVVRYKNGKLIQAVTRGDGQIGEDVTHTARTISSLPQTLVLPVDLICVGEVWLGKKEFFRVNDERTRANESLFANPRNAAAGSLRQLDPAVAKARALSFFAYDIDWFEPKDTKLGAPKTQFEELTLLKELGLTTSKYSTACRSLEEVEAYYHKWVKKRERLPYGIDGVVVKVDQVSIQKAVGYTAKAPRFGIAYKFPAVQTTTVVEDIQLQVGRTGVVTPVAHLRPVFIDGSTVARATLHNYDQISRLDVRVGDTVILQKAGDVIPEVVMVLKELRPENTKPYKFPKKVAGCGGDGSIWRTEGEAAYRCVSMDSKTIHRLRLHYFVSKTAFNIDGVGPKVVDALLDSKLISIPADLFTLTHEDFLTLPGFKDKSAQNAVEAIAKAKIQTLTTVLVALSIDQVGEETARLLAHRYDSLAEIAKASKEDLVAIHGVGEIVANEVVAWFTSRENQKELTALLSQIEVTPQMRTSSTTALSGKRVVITGTLSLPRDEVKKQIRHAGGTVVGSVSKKTDYVLVGSDPGSKVEIARELGIPIISESQFAKLLS